ncbi:MAG: hypothetical protein HMLKMBBP_03864 [Planctomycetes bacterium]|nr:hypothetical protein [Planctomycetota bacterium]
MRRRYLAALLALAGCASGARDGVPRPAPPDAAAPGVAARAASATDDVPDRPLTLKECIEVAVSRRGIVRRAELAVLIARARTDETFAQILPRVSVDLRGESRNNDRGAVFDGAEARMTGDRTVGTGSLSLIVPIYDFGGSMSKIDAAEARTRSAEHDGVRARHDLALAVSRAYFRVLEARKVIEVVDESLRVVERQLAAARDFERAGLVARNDVLTAEVQLARRRQESIEAHSNVEFAVETLNRVAGLDLARRTEVVDVLEASAWDGPLGEALAAAAERRPELLSLSEQIKAARSEHEAIAAEYLPGIFAFGSLNHTTDSFTLNKDWAAGGVGVRWSVFDGWASDARRRRTREETRDLQESRDELAIEIALGVRTAYRDVRDTAERVPVARQAIALAEENLRVVRDQFGAGLVTTADVLVEEERLASGRSTYFRTLYDYHDAVARLSHAVGGDLLADSRSRP